MRLLKRDSRGELTLTKDLVDNIPPYAILSHTWSINDDEEVTFNDLRTKGGESKPGWAKIDFCGEQAKLDEGLEHFWVDTCCIDKANHSELSEAINSMFGWYRDAAKCYVYLSDVAADGDDCEHSRHEWEAAFRSSRWFKRGWTLQELLAPISVEFFSQDKKYLGSKKTLELLIHDITKIPIPALRGELSPFSFDERWRWAAGRDTKRQEDKAYCMLGLFNVFLPLIYGEKEHAIERLKEEVNRRLNPSVGRPETPPAPSCAIPFSQDVDFIDHGNILSQIEEKCAVPAARVALVGLGGVGKSQLAIEYCHRLHKKSPSTWIFWVHASNPERIEQDYREIAELVKIPGRKDPQNNIFDLVPRWLRDEKKGKWLLVLDNAEDDMVLSTPHASALGTAPTGKSSQLKRPLTAFLPQSANGALLVTIRTKTAATKLVEPRNMIMVNPMAKSEAAALLQKKLEVTGNYSDLEELANDLDCMPLAIVQAAAYIQQKDRGYGVRHYIEEFRRSDKRKISLLDYEAGHLRRDPEAMNSIIITWEISFNYIRQHWPSSANLIALMSFFDRQGIPKEILTVQTQEDGAANKDCTKDQDQGLKTQQESASRWSSDDSSDHLEDDIDRLRSYSFISAGVDEKTFEMHALVQLATRKWLLMQGEDERWREVFCQRLNTMFPYEHHENWDECERLYPHAKAAEQQQPSSDVYLREWGRVLRKAGWYAIAKGDYIEAESVCSKSAQGLEQAFGKDDRDTLSSMGSLASAYWRQGRWKEAEEIEVEVYKTYRRLLGEEHPDTLTSMADMATTYWNQGRWAEAGKIHKELVETRRRVLGKEHPDTLTSMGNLALVYWDQGRWTEAEKIEKEVSEAYRRVLGDTHPDTLSSIGNLASTYRAQGRWLEAEKMEKELLQTRQHILGDEHPDTLISIGNLALTYKRQGRWAEAEKMEIDVLETHKRVLGKEHPNTLVSMGNLVLTYIKQARFTEAEKMGEEVLEKRRRVQGLEHPDTLASMNNLATTYWNQGRWLEAEKIHKDVLEICQRVLGKEHPTTLSSMANLASTYLRLERLPEAEKIEKEVLETRRRVLGEEHPDTLFTMNNLAFTVQAQGRKDEAVDLLSQCLRVRTRVLGAEHPSTLDSSEALAEWQREPPAWGEAFSLLPLVRRFWGGKK